MTIEATFNRIANALEQIASNGGQAVPAPAQPPAAAEPEKKGPGRPKKDPAPTPAPAPAPAPEPADDFLGGDEPTAKAYTREQVREALVKFQKAHSPEAARKVLKEVGGADTLVKLAEDKFEAVIKATAG